MLIVLGIGITHKVYHRAFYRLASYGFTAIRNGYSPRNMSPCETIPCRWKMWFALFNWLLQGSIGPRFTIVSNGTKHRSQQSRYPEPVPYA